ncbi:MAG: ArsR/SmtB family transcription factor [Candidatus Binataceae bacterium]
MSAVYQSRDSANNAAEQLKVYAQPQRLMILSRLLDRECTVSEIDEATGIGQPALSQQLAELRRAELVQNRRSAKQVYYRLADDDVSVCVRSIEAIFGSGRGVVAVASGVVAEKPKRRQKELGSAGAAAFAKIV